jgi:hypothetical protein
MMRYLYVCVIFLALLTGCSDLARQVQIQTADAVAQGANAALPMLIERYRSSGNAIIESAETRGAAEVALADLKESWAPVWEAWDGLAVAHAAWARALETEEESLVVALEALKEAYCRLRERWPKEIPAVPIVPVSCEVRP